MELAKKPIKFLCNVTADTFRISVPKTEHHYLFFRNQPYLVKYDLDIEFFDEHLMFNRYEDPEPDEPGDQEGSGEVDHDTPEEKTDLSEEEHSPGEEESDLVPEAKKYSKEELHKMRKSDVRDILKELAPEKTCPVRKENIIKVILEAQ